MADFADRNPFDGQFYFRPLIPLLFSLMTGIVAAHCFPGHFIPALAVFFAAAAATGYCCISNKPCQFSPLLLYIALGYLCLSPWQLIPDAADHISRFLNDTEKSWQISGRITTEPNRESYRLTFILTGIRLSDPNHPAAVKPVRGKLRVSVYRPDRGLRMGTRIRFHSKIRPFHNFNNPGGFDYKSFMAYKNIWGSAYTAGNKLQIQKEPSTLLATAVPAKLRRSVSALIDKSVDADSRAILSALVLGNRDLLSPSIKNAFNRAGVSHVLAISGLHIGIIATFAFFFFKHLLALLPPLLYRGWPRKGAAVLAIFPVLIYGLLAGMSPSTQRAVIMVSVFLLSFLIERDHDLPNTLAAAALIILIAYPPSLFSISFQLSFIAVTAILFGLATLQTQRMIPNIPVIKPVFTFMAVSFFAIMGTTPLIMHYFNQAAFFGILTNLLIIPVFGFFVVPLALFSVLVLFPVHPPLAVLGMKTAGKGISLGLTLICPIGQWPWSAVKTVTPSILELVCIYTLLFGMLYIIRHKHLLTRKNLKHPIVLSMAAAICLLAVDIGYWCHDRFWTDRLKATIIDVGQGSAALLELPGGYRTLVDGGGFSSNAAFDVGKNVVAPFLWDRKIRRIDMVVLSHPDADHLNGLIYIINHFHVKQVLSTHQPSDTREYSEFIQAINTKKIKHPPFDRIPRQFCINGVKFDILHPHPKDSQVNHASAANNHSIVLKASYKGQSLLLPGDIMKAAEKVLVAEAGKALRASVLLAPHHGSKTSNTKDFLDAVRPRAVIVSAGPQNRFELPSPKIIERYRQRGCNVLMTNNNGAVEVQIDEKQVALRPVCGDPLRFPLKSPDF